METGQLQPTSTAISPPPKKIDWKYQFQQYGAAFEVAIPLFVILSFYLFFRYGYYNLYIINKIDGVVAVLLLGIILFIGPLSRLFSFADMYVQYRKELGVVALLFASIHSFTGLFLLPSIFPLSEFFATLLWPFIFGISALLVLIGLFIISRARVTAALGGKLWWQLQYWGIRLAFVLIIFHVFILKWSEWVAWYTIGGASELAHPQWPDIDLLLGWFMVFVVLMRLAEFTSKKLGRITWYVSAILLPVIYIATFLWGTHFGI